MFTYQPLSIRQLTTLSLHILFNLHKYIKYLGFYWEGYFIERTVLATKTVVVCISVFQTVIRFILHQGCFYSLNYIDDNLILGKASVCQQCFEGLKKNYYQNKVSLLATTKQSNPVQKLWCFSKLHCVYTWEKVGRSDTCSKWELHSLLGSLLSISKCVKYSLYFLNRLLETLRNNHSNKTFKLDNDFHKDILWFDSFLETFNGVSFFHKNHWSHHIFRCLFGRYWLYTLW